MIKQQAKRQFYCIMLALLLLAVMLVGGRYISSAFADTPQYTNALTDLQKDSEFNVADYPDNAKDYSIRFIQIAESTDKELFVYTYQPSQKTTYLVATEINMSLTDKMGGKVDNNNELTDTDKPKLYGLTLINNDGVFCKYKVNDFTVSDEVTRYYNISSIYREWQKGIDKETGNDNTKNAVAFNVGKLYRVTTENGVVKYLCKRIETVQIINPVAGYLEYSNGFKFFPDWCHSHYVAFSTDWEIDKLMEADVSYVRRDASCSTGLGLDGKTHYENESAEIAALNGEQKGGNTADGFLAKKYEWERIQTVDEFKADKQNALTDSAKEKLNGQQWVLRFVETTIKLIGGYGSTTKFWTDISEVTVLRLKFVSDGDVYNLGAVSDKVTEGDKPDNTNTNEFASLWEWLSRLTGIPEWVWKLLAAIIPLAILLPILSAIFPVVGQVLALIFGALLKAFIWLFKGLLWLVCLPFKGIATLIRKIKDKKDGG